MIISKALLPGNKSFVYDNASKSEDLKVNVTGYSVNHPARPKTGLSIAKTSHEKGIPDNCASAKPVLKLNTKNPQDLLESDELIIRLHNIQTLSLEQFANYAAKMEKARKSLLQMLVQEPESLTVLAHEYLSRIDRGYDKSEMLSVSQEKQSSELVQGNPFVQVTVKQLESDLCTVFRKILAEPNVKHDQYGYPDLFKFIVEIRFLPAFLHQVATRVIEGSSPGQKDKISLNKQILLLEDSRQIIVKGNLRLVAYIANQYKQSKLPFSDLMQEGTIGLIKAIDRFDYERPVKFSTYAIYWIRQTISRAIIRQKKTVRLPFNLAPKASAVFEAVNTSLQKTNKTPSARELADICQLSVKEIESILQCYQPTVSLSAHVNNDEEMPILMDTIEQRNFPLPFTLLSTNALQVSLNDAINSLPAREAKVLCARFGVNSSVEMTLQDIADQLHVSRERVRQIQNIALQKIRAVYGVELSDFLTPDLP
ncbi:MAG: sigma-70 family RNA polymerase sigma factor [Nitrospinales bacterium]